MGTCVLCTVRVVDAYAYCATVWFKIDQLVRQSSTLIDHRSDSCTFGELFSGKIIKNNRIHSWQPHLCTRISPVIAYVIVCLGWHDMSIMISAVPQTIHCNPFHSACVIMSVLYAVFRSQLDGAKYSFLFCARSDEFFVENFSSNSVWVLWHY